MQKNYSNYLDNDFDTTLILLGPQFFAIEGNKKPTEELFAESLESLLDSNRSISDYIYPHDKEIFEDSIKTCLDSGASKVQCRIIAKDRKVKCVLARMKLIKDSVILLNLVDITIEVTEYHKLLGTSEAEFYTLAQYVPIGVFKLDASGKIFTFINEMYQEMLGANLEEANAGKWMDSIHPEDRDHFLSLRSKAPSNKPFVIDIRIQKKDDPESRYVRINKRPLFGKDGSVIGAVGTVRDIDDQIRNEKILHLHREKLLATAKMSTLGEMTGSIAHEINNPLTIIYGSAMILETLLKSPESDSKAIKEQVQIIYFTIERISKIIRGLRTFSRNSSSDPMEKKLLSQIIEDTLLLCQDKFKSRGIELRFDLEQIKYSSIRCRPVQISQVLLNLLNNSFDAISKDSEKWVEIKATKTSQEIYLSIIDSGPGIPSALESRIMTPFFTTKKAGKGTGLGLSVSKALIEEHHGEFYYESRAPHTTFVIELPLYESL